jgi:hypothetical protein
MITDYSWATMHAAMEIFFKKHIFEYSGHVFELSKINSKMRRLKRCTNS